MLLEEFKKPKEQNDKTIVRRKKFFGDKENIELNRINQRSVTMETQEPMGHLIHKPNSTCPSFLDKNERFNQPEVWVSEQRERERLLNQRKEKIDQKALNRLESDITKWSITDQKYIEEQRRAEIRMKNRKESNINYAQGFNLISMQYENNRKGNLLKENDYKAQERFTKRAQMLFEKNNGQYDIFTGQPKKFKTVDILDNFI